MKDLLSYAESEVDATEVLNSVCNNGEPGDAHVCWLLVTPTGGVEGTSSTSCFLFLRDDARRTRLWRGEALGTRKEGEGVLRSIK